MHLSEFKAWFDGFTEEMKGPPTKDQWAKIKKCVKEISANYTPPTIFVNDYYRPWRRYWDYQPYWATCGVGVSTTTNNAAVATSSYTHALARADYASADGAQVALSDWTAAGKAEFLSEAP